MEKKIKLLEKYKTTFSKVNRKVNILERNDNSEFVYKKIDFKRVMADLNQTLIIRNLHAYRKFNNEMDLIPIRDLLRKSNVMFSRVVVDKEFDEELKIVFYSQFMIIPEKNKRSLYLVVPTTEKQLPESIDENTQNYLIKSLLQKQSSLVGSYMFGRSIRRCMIGISGYEPICTTQVMFGIGKSQHSNVGYVISPITAKQWESYKDLPVEKFVEVISSCQEFSNLVDHVYEYSIEKGKYSKEEIRKCYKEFMREMYEVCKEES